MSNAPRLLFISLFLSYFQPLHPAETSLVDWNIEAALLLRAAILEDITRPLEYGLMPDGLVSAADRHSSRYHELWKAFFVSAIPHVGARDTTNPEFVYINPLAEVLLMARWSGMPDRPQLVTLCALPIAVADEAWTEEVPYWTLQQDALSSMMEIARLSIDMIDQLFPTTGVPSDPAAGPDRSLFCQRELQAIAEFRIQKLIAGVEELARALPQLSQLLKPLDGYATEATLESAWPHVPHTDQQSVLALGANARALLPAAAIATPDSGYLLFVAHKYTGRLYALVIAANTDDVSVQRFLDVDVRRRQ